MDLSQGIIKGIIDRVKCGKLEPTEYKLEPIEYEFSTGRKKKEFQKKISFKLKKVDNATLKKLEEPAEYGYRYSLGSRYSGDSTSAMRGEKATQIELTQIELVAESDYYVLNERIRNKDWEEFQKWKASKKAIAKEKGRPQNGHRQLIF